MAVPNNMRRTDTQSEKNGVYDSAIFEASNGHKLAKFIQQQKGVRKAVGPIFQDISSQCQSYNIEIESIDSENAERQNLNDKEEAQSNNQQRRGQSRLNEKKMMSPLLQNSPFKSMRRSSHIRRRTLLKEFEKTVGSECLFQPPVCSTPITSKSQLVNRNDILTSQLESIPATSKVSSLSLDPGTKDDIVKQLQDENERLNILLQNAENKSVNEDFDKQKSICKEIHSNALVKEKHNSASVDKPPERIVLATSSQLDAILKIVEKSPRVRRETNPSRTLVTPERDSSPRKSLIATAKQREVLLKVLSKTTEKRISQSTLISPERNNTIQTEILHSNKLTATPKQREAFLRLISNRNVSSTSLFIQDRNKSQQVENLEAPSPNCQCDSPKTTPKKQNHQCSGRKKSQSNDIQQILTEQNEVDGNLKSKDNISTNTKCVKKSQGPIVSVIHNTISDQETQNILKPVDRNRTNGTSIIVIPIHQTINQAKDVDDNITVAIKENANNTNGTRVNTKINDQLITDDESENENSNIPLNLATRRLNQTKNDSAKILDLRIKRSTNPIELEAQRNSLISNEKSADFMKHNNVNKIIKTKYGKSNKINSKNNLNCKKVALQKIPLEKMKKISENGFIDIKKQQTRQSQSKAQKLGVETQKNVEVTEQYVPETQHDSEETQHDVEETEQYVPETQHDAEEIQHDVEETEQYVAETQHDAEETQHSKNNRNCTVALQKILPEKLKQFSENGCIDIKKPQTRQSQSKSQKLGVETQKNVEVTEQYVPETQHDAEETQHRKNNRNCTVALQRIPLEKLKQFSENGYIDIKKPQTRKSQSKSQKLGVETQKNVEVTEQYVPETQHDSEETQQMGAETQELAAETQELATEVQETNPKTQNTIRYSECFIPETQKSSANESELENSKMSTMPTLPSPFSDLILLNSFEENEIENEMIKPKNTKPRGKRKQNNKKKETSEVLTNYMKATNDFDKNRKSIEETNISKRILYTRGNSCENSPVDRRLTVKRTPTKSSSRFSNTINAPEENQNKFDNFLKPRTPPPKKIKQKRSDYSTHSSPELRTNLNRQKSIQEKSICRPVEPDLLVIKKSGSKRQINPIPSSSSSSSSISAHQESSENGDSVESIGIRKLTRKRRPPVAYWCNDPTNYMLIGHNLIQNYENKKTKISQSSKAEINKKSKKNNKIDKVSVNTAENITELQELPETNLNSKKNKTKQKNKKAASTSFHNHVEPVVSTTNSDANRLDDSSDTSSKSSKAELNKKSKKNNKIDKVSANTAENVTELQELPETNLNSKRNKTKQKNKKAASTSFHNHEEPVVSTTNSDTTRLDDSSDISSKSSHNSTIVKKTKQTKAKSNYGDRSQVSLNKEKSSSISKSSKSNIANKESIPLETFDRSFGISSSQTFNNLFDSLKNSKERCGKESTRNEEVHQSSIESCTTTKPGPKKTNRKKKLQIGSIPESEIEHLPEMPQADRTASCISSIGSDQNHQATEEEDTNYWANLQGNQPNLGNSSKMDFLLNWLCKMIEKKSNDTNSSSSDFTVSKVVRHAKGFESASVDDLVFYESDGVEYAFYSGTVRDNIGYLRFHPHGEKKLIKSKKYQLRFIVICGTLLFTCNGTSSEFKNGELITVEKGSAYSIKNSTDNPALLMIMKQ